MSSRIKTLFLALPLLLPLSGRAQIQVTDERRFVMVTV
jgi:hypothetical protein